MNNMFYGMTNTEIFLIIGIIILLIVDFIIIPGMTLADKIDSIQMFCDACIFTIIWFFAMLLIFCVFFVDKPIHYKEKPHTVIEVHIKNDNSKE